MLPDSPFDGGTFIFELHLNPGVKLFMAVWAVKLGTEPAAAKEVRGGAFQIPAA